MNNLDLIMINDLIEIVGSGTKQVFRVSSKIKNIVYSQNGEEYKLEDSNFQGSWPTKGGEIIHVFLE